MTTARPGPGGRPPGWPQEHARRYLATGGGDGHIWEGVPTLLLTTTGRRSGESLHASQQDHRRGHGRDRPGAGPHHRQVEGCGTLQGPILRGLAGRAPYFHNGSAATPAGAVNFYDTRFDLGLTDQQKADLVAFLRTL